MSTMVQADKRLTIDVFKLEAKQLIKGMRYDEVYLLDSLVKCVFEWCKKDRVEKLKKLFSEPDDDEWGAIQAAYIIDSKGAGIGSSRKSIKDRVLENDQACGLLSTLLVKIYDAKVVPKQEMATFKNRVCAVGMPTVKMYWNFKSTRPTIPWGLRICLEDDYKTWFPHATYGQFNFMNLIEDHSDDEGEKELKKPERFDTLPPEYQVSGLENEVCEAEKRMHALKKGYREEKEKIQKDIEDKVKATKEAKKSEERKRSREKNKDYVFGAFGGTVAGCNFAVSLAEKYKKLRLDASQHFSGVPLAVFLGTDQSSRNVDTPSIESESPEEIKTTATDGQSKGPKEIATLASVSEDPNQTHLKEKEVLSEANATPEKGEENAGGGLLVSEPKTAQAEGNLTYLNPASKDSLEREVISDSMTVDTCTPEDGLVTNEGQVQNSNDVPEFDLEKYKGDLLVSKKPVAPEIGHVEPCNAPEGGETVDLDEAETGSDADESSGNSDNSADTEDISVEDFPPMENVSPQLSPRVFDNKDLL